MEVYKGKESGEAEEGVEEVVLELDLEEGEIEVAAKFIAVAVYFSQKSYNPKYLFYAKCMGDQGASCCEKAWRLLFQDRILMVGG
jgi:hypothetical protein